MNLHDLGYLRAAACAPELKLADPGANALIHADLLRTLSAEGAQLVLFPELSLCGYSCEDLFFNQSLLSQCQRALADVARVSAETGTVCVLGCPWLLNDGRLLNCAFVCASGMVQGAVPKTFQPNYSEFYERRWFASGRDINHHIEHPLLGKFWINTRQLFSLLGTRFALEICEDLWAPEPTGIEHALAGAEIILNPSASPELIAKADYRKNLVQMTSAQRICGYLYASSGAMESSKDLVYGGHLMAFENGQPLAESERFQLGTSHICTEFDFQKLRRDRSQHATFSQSPRPEPYVQVELACATQSLDSLQRQYPAHPFVPDDEAEVDARAREIFSIQATGLARRMLAAHTEHLILGLSGGLDSTLAYLVSLDALKKLELTPSNLHTLTIPGPGTTDQTLEIARDLAKSAGCTFAEIPIHEAVEQHLRDLKHTGEHDIVFENAQARERTQLLFNYANKSGGIVVGTGDLSELALGWCTFNADHMSSYNVNVGVPKTLVKYLIRWYANHRAGAALRRLLDRILELPITPELLPPNETGGISQSTEAIIGPYALHDFFIFHFVRNGFSPRKIEFIANRSFSIEYSSSEIHHWLTVFIQRFFQQQFKRTTLPPGPKIGTISLSPRGDWRMPDEAQVRGFLQEIDNS